jgi:hypothetical protein
LETSDVVLPLRCANPGSEIRHLVACYCPSSLFLERDSCVFSFLFMGDVQLGVFFFKEGRHNPPLVINNAYKPLKSLNKCLRMLYAFHLQCQKSVVMV